MNRLTNEQRLQIIEFYYQNQCSVRNVFRALRPIYGLHNRPSEQTINAIVTKFRTQSTLLDITPTTRMRTVRTEENIASVSESVAEDREMSIRRRSQQLGLCYSTTWKILRKDLGVKPYKIQLVQELKPNESKNKSKKSGNKRGNKKDEEEKPALQLPKGALIYFDGVTDETLKREVIKEELENMGAQVAFIEYNKGDKSGHIRLSVENSAKTVLEKLEDNKLKLKDTEVELTLKLVEGEEEDELLKKAVESMQTRRNSSRQHSNKGGHGRHSNKGGHGGGGGHHHNNRKRRGHNRHDNETDDIDNGADEPPAKQEKETAKQEKETAKQEKETEA